MPNNPEDYKDSLTNKYSWLITYPGRALHYCPDITWETWDEWWEEDEPNAWPKIGYRNPHVDTICGRLIRATLPGIFTRMGRARCKQCCKALGIPEGIGTPVNDASLNSLRDELKNVVQ